MKQQEVIISARQIQNMEQFMSFWNDHKDGEYLMTTRSIRKRSLPQNAYYRGVVLPIMRVALYYRGGFEQILTTDQAHEFLLSMFNRIKLVSIKTGDMLDIIQRSSELSVPEFEEFLERIRMWAAEYLGTYIPDPNEPLVILDDYIQSIINETDQ